MEWFLAVLMVFLYLERWDRLFREYVSHLIAPVSAPSEYYYSVTDALSSRSPFLEMVFLTQPISPEQVETITGRYKGTEKDYLKSQTTPLSNCTISLTSNEILSFSIALWWTVKYKGITLVLSLPISQVQTTTHSGILHDLNNYW